MNAHSMNAMRAEAERIYVAFDSQSGQIVHIHRVTDFVAGNVPNRDLEEKRVLELAARAGHPLEGLRVLGVDPTEVDLRRHHRVDVGASRLVRVDKT